MKTLAGYVLLSMAIPSHGQTPVPPKFEVTSVRQVKIVAGQRRNVQFGCSNGRFASLGQGLRRILLWAFDVKPFQIATWPPWTDSPDAIFDIEAKSENAVSEEQCKLMVQTLLADRFQLAVHRETKDLPSYALVVAKNGPKLHQVPPDAKPKPGGGVRLFGNPIGMPPGKEPPVGWSMTELANMLTGTPTLDARPVFDRTGLTGIYEIDLDFAMFPNQQPPRPEVFDAVQEQLGLKLDSMKAPVEMLVVDRLERPAAN
jgi:uncharacterized protein (TIGR03435 family)